MENLLTPEEARVIGALIEKEKTTPEYYPLSLNSLVNACNQKSNRNPVVDYSEDIVELTIGKLRDKRFVRRVTGSDMRVPKYRQVFTEELNLSDAEAAIICVLMLRGPQTLGELRTRCGRLYNFENLLQVEEVLSALAGREEAMAVKLPRQSWMKESRYKHLLCGEPEINTTPDVEEDTAGENNKLEELESEIEKLKDELDTLRDEFEKFKNQF